MPRQGRIQSGTGVYHVMMRGINHQRIFEDSEDHYTFLQCLRRAQEQFAPLGDRLPNSCHYYAYALMSNHFHLLLHAKDDTVGNIVKRIASSYVYYFNRKYGRDGHLFQERFKSQPVGDWDYFLTLLRYIHQNPLKPHLVSSLREYKWSSWLEYIGQEKNAFCATKIVLIGHRALSRLTGVAYSIVQRATSAENEKRLQSGMVCESTLEDEDWFSYCSPDEFDPYPEY